MKVTFYVTTNLGGEFADYRKTFDVAMPPFVGMALRCGRFEVPVNAIVYDTVAGEVVAITKVATFKDDKWHAAADEELQAAGWEKLKK